MWRLIICYGYARFRSQALPSQSVMLCFSALSSSLRIVTSFASEDPYRRNIVDFPSASRALRLRLLIPLCYILTFRLIRFVPTLALHQIDQTSFSRSQLSDSPSKRSSSRSRPRRCRIVFLFMKRHRRDIEWVAEEFVVFSVFVLKLLGTVSKIWKLN